ncbi:RHS repeat-associated core domain-containing protein [Pseudomonas sp. 18175]|uniref:RHS repeat-associated core domain-containing protein n=1 Tax=Pseudomonas sp. 18175 TaxID=3390056 RepID=UPI003D1F53E6
MFPISNSLRNPIFFCLSVLLFLAPTAYAEEVKKQWENSFTGGQPRTTEKLAQRDIEELYSRYETDKPFAWEVKKQTVMGNKVLYHYRIQPDEIVTTDWIYKYNGQEFTSEDEVFEAMRVKLAGPPQCPATSVVPGEWTGIGGVGVGDDGSSIADENWANYVFYSYFEPTGNCSEIAGRERAERTRTAKCPNRPYAAWDPSLEACVPPRQDDGGASRILTYWSTPLTCPTDKLGNPCDPTTGNKIQTEPTDVDLGWVSFSRRYQSLSSSAGGAFGPGWTHSQNVRLTAGADEWSFPPNPELQVGVVEGNGSQSAFKKVGTQYEAMGGGGDRIEKQGDSWKLYRSDQVLNFNADGLLQSRTMEDSTTLSYSYDVRSRLLSITHSSGRSLLFHYEAPAGDDLISGISVAGQLVASYSYSASGQVASVTYADGTTRSYHYEDTRFPQYLTGITAEDARRYSWYSYDAKGRVTCSRHSGDCSQTDVGVDGVRLEYTPVGTTIVTDALGKVSTYALTASGASGLPRKVTSITDPQGSESRTFYSEAQDFRRRLESLTDRRGIQTKYAYAEAIDPVSGKPVSVQTTTEAFGLPEQRVTETYTDVATNRELVSRIGDRETRTTRNARLQPISIAVRDVSGSEVRTTTISYCEEADVVAGGNCPQLGLLKSIDGPRSDVSDTTSYSYYPNDDVGCADPAAGSCHFRKGDLHTLTNALGHTVETLAYDSLGRPLSVKDSNGVVSDYTYHPRGWPTSVTVRGADGAGDRSTSITYWPTGQVQQVAEADGASVTYVYDAAQRLTDITDDAGNTLHYTLDDAGNRLKEDTVDSGGTLRRTLARIYNTLGQLTTIKDAGNNATGFAYDVNSNLQSVTDALQRVTQQSYDPLNRLARTLQDVDGVAAEIRTTYNALDQVTQTTDPKGLHTTYVYNGFGDLTAQASPDSGGTNFTADAAGNRITRTDARGITATYHYDALNRLVGAGYPDPNLDVGYSYDVAPAVCAAGEQFARGRMGQALHSGGSTSYCYDRFGQLTRKVQTINSVSSTLRYSYTKAGRLAALTYPDGSVADYVRDAQGRISQIGLTRPGQGRQVVIRDVTHAAFGPATGWTYGNGRQLQRPLDLDYRPQAIYDPASSGLSLGYGYDSVGAVTELKNGTGSTTLAKYGYDSLGRLTQTKDGASGTAIETYTYDATGNRTSLITAAGTANYTYPAESHRLIAVDGEVRNHDAVGNTVSIGGQEFVYNDVNRLSTIKRGGAPVESYGYNHRGERVLRAPVAGDAQLTVYDEEGQWIGNYGVTGELQQQVIWLDNNPVVLINAASNSGPELAYVQPDHLGTPRVVIDPVRDVAIWAWSNKSEVFGNQAPNTDPDGDGQTYELSLRFPGQQATEASEMFYNYQREYGPAVGRYSQSDPIGLAGGISTYAYAGGSPNSVVDPYGLFGWADMPSLPNWLVDGAAGFGDGLSGGLTRVVRDWADIGSVDYCSTTYQGSEWAGIGAGLAVPAARLGYVYKVGQLPKAGLTVEQTVAARNALKGYYRGRPLDTLLPKVSGRFANPTAEQLLVRHNGNAARVIEGAGRTSNQWTTGIVSGSGAKAANSAANAGERCGCN